MDLFGPAFWQNWLTSIEARWAEEREGARRMLLAALEAEVATPAATYGLDRPQ